MEEKKGTIFTNSMYFGAILGFTLIIISLISYLTGSMNSLSAQKVSSFFQYAVIIIGIIIGTKQLRTNENGIISYGRALGSGTLISFFSSIALAIYTFISLKYIDPIQIDKFVELAKQNIAESAASEEQLEYAVEATKLFITPTVISITAIFSMTFMGFIFSLFTSIVLKKEGSTVPWKRDIDEHNEDDKPEVVDNYKSDKES